MNCSDFTIASLLPYSNSSVLTDRNQKLNELQLIQKIILVSIAALKNFSQGKLTKFDAQVGENLCQIRAYKNICLAKKWLNTEENKKKITQIIYQLTEYYKRVKQFIANWKFLIQQTKHYEINLDKPESIDDFLGKNMFELALEEDIVYLISSFFLSYFSVKISGIPLSIDFKKISLKLNVSKHRAERLTHRYQLIVSKLGCDFILKIAEELPFKKRYSKLLPALYRLSDVERTVLPCYLVSEIIFEHCIKEKIPMLILFNRIRLEQKEIVYFLLEGDEYASFREDKYCLVILGDNLSKKETTTEYINFLNNLNPVELILANTATHPQYAGKRLKEYSDNPFLCLFEKNDEDALFFSHRLETLKELAKQIGCSKEFQLEFFLRHIYASSLAHELNKLQLLIDTVVNSSSTLLNSKSILRKSMCNEKTIVF